MNRAEAYEFASQHHRAVLMTRRRDGGIQASPVLVGVDDERLVVSSTEPAFKVRNLRRDPRASLCILTDDFFGRWVFVEGATEIVSLPDAMEGLVDYYRRISGEHPHWDEYRRAMEAEQRALLRISIDRVGPTRSA